MSAFIESVDDMIGRHFAHDAVSVLRELLRFDPSHWAPTETIVYQLIRASIAHARRQVERRGTGTMTFEEAMAQVRTRNAMVTRQGWDIFRTICLEPGLDPEDDDYTNELFDFALDNCDGTRTGSGGLYQPTDEDRAASDWMPYESPDRNWVELRF